MKPYDHKKIETKWQKEWVRKGIYKSKELADLPKSYVLDMFPYPSGEGLHVGHPKGYIATDVYSRFKKMSGYNILHPMGWDAFGLPAENYAIKNKTHPRKDVEKNIKRYKKQLSVIGLNYDWSREINTTDPSYYTWTQWIFLQMYKKGLAYQSFEPINWCPSCQTGLANEDLEDGKCERCGSVVEKRPIRQWVLKITDYAEKLLSGLSGLDWPEHIKESQRNWIGKSEGAEIDFRIEFESGQKSELISVFTTRPDTLYGATFLVLSPEHPWVTLALNENHKDVLKNTEEVRAYTRSAASKTEIERTDATKNKTGVALQGVFAVNPASGDKLPIFVADYVFAEHGTGAVMGVPAHDQRDFDFAQKFNLPMKEVIRPHRIDPVNPPVNEKKTYTGEGILISSGKFDGFNSTEAKGKIVSSVGGRMVTRYKLCDWVFSRQRYWGEPIPLIHCEKCGVVAVPEKDLPVKLPDVKKYEPTGTGESPLAEISKWVNVKCPTCKGKAKRETNTMPQWAGSCWYYLRFMDPKNKKAIVDPKKEKYWAPVDVYVGGAEHATRHLIYARFWHKFLFEHGVVSTSEPFQRLYSVGLILAEDGRKMSKRFGNVVNPDEIIALYGADTFRIYEMFMGPFGQASGWDTKSIMGSRRFIERIWRMSEKVQVKNVAGSNQDPKFQQILHSTISKVTNDIDSFSFNTAISSLMILSKSFEEQAAIMRSDFEIFLKLLAPFAPHVADELWGKMENKQSIHTSDWPIFDQSKIVKTIVRIAIQVNGKVRGEIEVPAGSSETDVKAKAVELESVKKWLNGEIKRAIFVKDRLLNIVIG